MDDVRGGSLLMRVLVLGSGGREHALVHAVAKSSLVDEVICAPGNDGMGREARCVAVELGDLDAVVKLAREERVGLVVVGPEDPLAAGVSDRLADAGVPVFGPSAEAARLESSKAFAKDFMARHDIPTAGHRVFDDADAADAHVEALGGPCVVKADGLAAGKGVFVCSEPAQAKTAIDEIMREQRFGAAGACVVIEERLVGEEASFYAISDGERFVCLPAAQDFKRALDGDRGENTGGMGAYSPTPVVDATMEQKIVERIVRPVFDGMRAEGSPYRGVLYVGLMITQGEPYVIEFNVRFGDPETQPLMLRLDSDLVPILQAVAASELPEDAAVHFGDCAVCVVMASPGYPRSYPKGVSIDGCDAAEELPGVKLFHAGTKLVDGGWVTSGGRVLGVTARGPSLAEARERAYQAVGRIRFEGAQVRSDIAERASRR
jgi:phosphoribosylamine--glycine ligase